MKTAQTPPTAHALYTRRRKEADPTLRLSGTYYAMRSRCLSERFYNFHLYGGRGIKIDKQWMSFRSFKAWAISAGWKPGLQIDRIDQNGDYTPSNCRFVTSKINNRNRRNNKLNDEKVSEIRKMLHEGKNGPEIASKFGIHKSLVYRIKLNQNWV